MESLLHYTHLLAHVLIGFYFTFFGFWNIYHWTPILQIMIQKKIPHPIFILQIGIVWQTVAGSMIMFGFHVTLAALLLLPFTIIAVFMFHPFWKHRGELQHLNFTIFITNLTISLGGLLLLIAPKA